MKIRRLPSNRWIMRQTWRNVLFLHWPVPAESLRPFVPAPLAIDTFRGSAWIGIVAFTMKGIFFRGMPFSVVRPFSEVNVRTYVSYRGIPGVFFLSLDVDDWASFHIAKHWYQLPYFQAGISLKENKGIYHLESVRQDNRSIGFQGSCEPFGKHFFPDEGTIDFWLTEKYRFYTTRNGRDLRYGDILHPPWPLKKAKIELEQHTLFSPLNIEVPGGPPIAHFSDGVDSLMWNAQKLRINE